MSFIITQIFCFIFAFTIFIFGVFGYIENSWVNTIFIVVLSFFGYVIGIAGDNKLLQKSITEIAASNGENLKTLINYAKERVKS